MQIGSKMGIYREKKVRRWKTGHVDITYGVNHGPRPRVLEQSQLQVQAPRLQQRSPSNPDLFQG